MNIEDHPYYKDEVRKIKYIWSYLQMKYFAQMATDTLREDAKDTFEKLIKDQKVDTNKIQFYDFTYDDTLRNFTFKCLILPIKIINKLEFNPFINSYFTRR